MNKVILTLLLLTASHLTKAADVGYPVEGGRSPDGKMNVVQVNEGDGEGYFVVRNADGKTVFSGESIQNEYVNQRAFPVWKAVWRSDSQDVAVAFHVSKFGVETVVLHRMQDTFQNVSIPEFDRAKGDEVDVTHRMPSRWKQNGDLVMDVTTGYHTKSDGEGITGHFVTIRFTGNPLKGVCRLQTKEVDRNER